jgi:hypothetical protein
MINSPFSYFDATTGEYHPGRNISSICRLLDYCQEKGITVVYGEYNPPTWDMKQDQKWIDMSVDYLNLLVNVKGYDCIKHFIIFNEPDGHWASTNGDYAMWQSMLTRFHAKMQEYPGLRDKVSFAGPDAVSNYTNVNSNLGTADWLNNTVSNVDSIIGLYDIHAYPGQTEVRNGSYGKRLKEYRKLVPQNKQIILGEAGYKYEQEADSLLMAEYNRRVLGHPFTKGSDCNMLVYDYFYGVDMPLLISEVMNAGFSGVAAWMLDDAMHSSGDSGKTSDLKIWGMWNILGQEVFGDADQEEIRPWYYTWSLMCRYFPMGCDVLKSEISKPDSGIFTVSAQTVDNLLTVAVINVSNDSRKASISLPRPLKDAQSFKFTELDGIAKDEHGIPLPESTNINGDKITVNLPANSLTLITEMK